MKIIKTDPKKNAAILEIVVLGLLYLFLSIVTDV